MAPLGAGGMGVVWRARRETGQTAALKLVRADEPSSRLHRAIHNEIRAVARLDHPGIVTVFDQGEVQGTLEEVDANGPWFAMEYAEQGTLQPLCGRAGMEEVREILLQMLDALAHAHAHGVLHRDLKPANVLRFSDGRVKLADFGLARHNLRDVAVGSSGAGTRSYMPPEQRRGSWRDEGPWTDLYALGRLTCALLTGSPLGAPAGLGELERWLATALAPEPNRRFSCAADAAWYLAQIEIPEGAAESLEQLVSQPTATAVPPLDLDADDTPMVVGQPLPKAPPRALEDWRPARIHRSVSAIGASLVGLRDPPLVGRDPECDQLWTALGEVHRARLLRVVALRGPSGVGKSRLAQWCAARADELGAARTLLARHAVVPAPGHGLRAMISGALRCQELTGEARLQRLQTVLPAHLVEDVDGLLDAKRLISARERHVSIGALLDCLAGERPLVLVLDDVQWAPDALSLVKYLLTRPPLPILVLLTCQEEALAEQPLAREALAEIVARPGAMELRLGPLEMAQRKALVAELLGFEGGLARSIATRTAGNPLFAIHLVRDWAERGLLERSPRGYRLTTAQSPPLPEDLAEVWSERIDRVLAELSPEAERDLELAAVLGQAVDAREWESVRDQLGIRADERLLPLLLDQRLADPHERGPDHGWTFVHGMLRESVVARCEAAGRARDVHLACAALLEDAGQPERLASHYLGAKAYSEALGPLRDAARRHILRADYGQSSVLVEKRLHTLELAGIPAEDPRWAVAEYDLAISVLNLGNNVRGAELSAALNERVQRHGHSAALAFRSARLRGLVLWRSGAYAEADVWMQKALRAPPVAEELSTSSSSGTADLYARMSLDHARVLIHLGRPEPASERLRQARVVFVELDLVADVADAEYLLGHCARHLGDNQTAARWFEAAGARYQQTGTLVRLAQTLNSLGTIAAVAGELDRARELFERALALHRKLGQPATIALLNLGEALLDNGEWAEARERLREAKSEAAAAGRPRMEVACEAALLACDAGLGRWTDFDQRAERIAELKERTGFRDPRIDDVLDRAASAASAAGQMQRATVALALGIRRSG